MDPVSITTAALTFVTAVKEAVELARKIEDSISRVSQNEENLHQLTRRIINMLENIRLFCDDPENQKDAGKLNEMYGGFYVLKEELRGIGEKLSLLGSSRSSGRFGKLKIGLRRFWERDRIETKIRALKEDLNDYQHDFQIFSGMRVERQLATSSRQLNTTTTTIISAIEHHGRTIQTTVHQLQQKSVEQSGKISSNNAFHLEIVDERLQRFVMARLSKYPKASTQLTMELVSDFYLIGEVDKVISLIDKFCDTSVSVVHWPEVWDALLDTGPISRRELRQKRALDSAARFRSIFTSADMQYSYDTLADAARHLGHFSAELTLLGHQEAAVSVYHCRVRCLRHVLDSKHSTSVSILIADLLHLASLARWTDSILTASLLSEANSLILSTDPGTQGLAILKAKALIFRHRIASQIESERISEATEAVLAMEKELHIKFSGDTLVSTVNKADINTYTYAQSLKHIALLFKRCKGKDLENEALLLKRALSVWKQYPLNDSYAAENKMEILYSLGSPSLRQYTSRDQAISYSKESAAIVRELHHADSQMWARSHYRVLQRHVDVLHSWGLSQEALHICQEIIGVAEFFLSDAKVAEIVLSKAEILSSLDLPLEAAPFYRRYNELVDSIYSPPSIDTRAGAQFERANALASAGNYSSAIPAARLALEYYCAHLESSQEPDSATSALAIAHASLGNILQEANEYDEALHESLTSIRLFLTISGSYEQTEWVWIAHESHVLSVIALRKNSTYMDDSLEYMRIMLNHDQQSRLDDISRVAAMHALYIDILVRKDLYAERRRLATTTFVWCCEQLDRAGDGLHSIWHLLSIQCALDYFDNGLYGSGKLSILKAIKYAEAARVPEFFLTFYRLWNSNFCSYLGDYSESLKDAEIYAQILGVPIYKSGSDERSALVSSSAGKDSSFVAASIHLSRILGLCGQYQRAVNYASEAFSASLRLSPSDNRKEHIQLGSLHILSNALMDADMEEEAIMYSKQIKESSIHGDPTHPCLRLPRSQPFRATYAQSILTTFFPCKQRTLKSPKFANFLRTLVAKRPGFIPELAVSLWTLNIFYCNHGLHEKGSASARELQDLKKRMQSSLTDVSDAIDRALRHEQSRPSWKAILTRINLKCGHLYKP